MADRKNAMDLLRDEDVELRRLVGELPPVRGASVEDRAVYGDVAKDLIRAVATREAAVTEVARAAARVEELGDVAAQLESERTERRELIDQVERMSRGVQGINLNQGQDFDGPLRKLISILNLEIDRDLDDVLPRVRSWFEGAGRSDELRSADQTSKHAPTNLSPSGPRWYERAPFISRLITIYDDLRDFPSAVRHR